MQAQHLIEQKPGLQALICAGAAGSLHEEVVLGDIVVGTATIEHDYKLRFVRRPLPYHQADARLLREFHLVPGQVDINCRLHFGIIASGDEDIVDRRRAWELREETKALCVAWEGAGAARAATFSGLPFLEVRAITDGADHAAAADFEGNLELSMAKLAQVLLQWSLSQR